MRTAFELALAAGISAIAAHAAAIPTFAVNDLTDTATVTDPGSTGRLTSVNCSGEGCTFTVSFPTGVGTITSYQLVAGGSVVPNFSSVFFLEPPSTFQVSDILTQTDATSSATFWQFTSDTESPLTLGSGTTLTENGTAQSAFTIQYKNVDGTVIAQDNITVQSDVEGVPEPSTGLIALSGLAGLGIVFRRRAAAR
jgi:hypothetical protein